MIPFIIDSRSYKSLLIIFSNKSWKDGVYNLLLSNATQTMLLFELKVYVYLINYLENNMFMAILDFGIWSVLFFYFL